MSAPRDADGDKDADEGEDERDVIACVANFSALPHLKYQIGLPRAGRWREVLNTDAAIYGGSGVATWAASRRCPSPTTGARLGHHTVPPLGVLWLTPEE